MPTVNRLRRTRGYEGPVIGVEIEVEGARLPNIVKGWRCEHDGSLRGESMEYVLPEPLLMADVETQLKHLNLAFLKNKTEVFDTGYAGIHIHVNVGDLEPMQLLRFILAYYTIEELALRWCGEDRQGNLFCLGLRAANAPLLYLQRAMEEASLGIVRSDDIRYAALNFKALADYGSLEFRSMRSTLDRKEILDWAGMLAELREFAFKDLRLDWFLHAVSAKGKDVLKDLLPNNYKMFYDMEGASDALRDAVRNYQLFLTTLDVDKMDKMWKHRCPDVVDKDEEAELRKPRAFQEAVDNLADAMRGAPPRPKPVVARGPLWAAPDFQNEPEEDI